MRAALDAITTRLPSPLNAALFTESVWPFSTAISSPLSASQMRAVLSKDAATTRLPSPLNAALSTEPVWLFSAATDRSHETGSRPRLPELGISQGQPSQPQPYHRRTGEDAQDNVQSVGNTPQPPQNGAQFLVLLAGHREQ